MAFEFNISIQSFYDKEESKSRFFVTYSDGMQDVFDDMVDALKAFNKQHEKVDPKTVYVSTIEFTVDTVFENKVISVFENYKFNKFSATNTTSTYVWTVTSGEPITNCLMDKLDDLTECGNTAIEDLAYRAYEKIGTSCYDGITDTEYNGSDDFDILKLRIKVCVPEKLKGDE